tara:strand:- start:1214 stop:2008 length:795 start_codon:yes stop_codon:yes gene_type:complete
MAEEKVLILDPNVQEQVNAELEATEEVVAETEQNYEIPNKFKDKSAQDIAKSYEELEKKLGRQAKELGDTRKLADDLLRQELDKNKQATAQQGIPSTTVEEPTEFDYDNPLESVKKVIQQELAPVREKLQATQDVSTRDRLAKQHPDYMDIAASPEFSDWVNSSPIRADLYRRANDQLEYNAAVELLDTWKALHPAKETPSRAATQKVTKQKINELSTEAGSTGQTSTKTFSRRELINLRATNPNKYYEMADEIRDAYANGRVR